LPSTFLQLTDRGFVEEVEKILEETGLAPQRLSLELTESVVMKNPEESIANLRRLKALGVSLEVDDFGTGYSSLSYLSCLPIDTVKIDRSFVAGLGEREDRSGIVRTIVELAGSLSLDVIAEGVETAQQVRKLLALGCGRGQGHYFSRPLGASAVPGLFEAGAPARIFGETGPLARVPDQQVPPAPAAGRDLEHIHGVLRTSAVLVKERK